MTIHTVTLITNIREVQFAGARLTAHALLLEPAEMDDLPNPRVRGFLSSGMSPVFSMEVETTHLTIQRDGAANLLTFFGRTGILVRSYNDHGLDIEKFRVDESHEEYSRIWRVMEEKVAAYWPLGSPFPRIVYTSVP